MSNKTKVMGYLTIIVVALSLISILYILLPGCEYCGDKFCLGNCVLNLNEGSGVPIWKNPSFGKLNQTTTRLAETKKAGTDYWNDVYFVGDSRTVALQFYEVDPGHLFAANGLNHVSAMHDEVVRLSENKIVSIPDAVMITAPKILIINFGINGVAFMDTEDFKTSYAALVDKLHEESPGSIIVLEAIFPIPSAYAASGNFCSNEKIDQTNEWIYQYASQKGYYYMATDEVLKDEYGDLPIQYSSDGTVHLNDAAYAVIKDYILRHAILAE